MKRAPTDRAEPLDEAAIDEEGEPTTETDLVAMVLAEHDARADAGEPAPIEGIVVAAIVALAGSGDPVVDLACIGRGPAEARSTIAVDARAIGREAAVMFERGDPRRPVVMGLIHEPAAVRRAPVDHELGAADHEPGAEEVLSAALAGGPLQVEADGERVVLSAPREIVLRCGEASITLTRAGKVLIKGAYVLSRASGVNRIRGGTVQIN